MPRQFQYRVSVLAFAFAFALVAGGAALAPSTANAQQDEALTSEFHFARLAFGAYGGSYGGGRGEPWLRDWPEADYHFMQGVTRLTLMNATTDSRQVRLDDDAIFNYPAIYAVKVGFMRLNEREATRLREYLERGGFLIVDDFHGPTEWSEFAASMQRVFPERPSIWTSAMPGSMPTMRSIRSR